MNLGEKWMPYYQYVARTLQGKTVTGSAEGINQSAVVKMLREKGLTTTSIQMGTTSTVGKRKQKQKRGGIRLDDLVIISRQFATMIRAGLPLIEVLNILTDQCEKVQLKNVLAQVQRDVEGGASLTEALRKHPRVFNVFFASMVHAGETAGMLDAILDQVATYLEKTAALQRKVKSAVMYPATVSIVAAIITTFLLIRVVPVFETIFKDLGSELPMITQITLGISKFLQNHYLLMLACIAAFVVFIIQWGKTASGRKAIDTFKLRIPIFGPLFLKVAIARFSRSLGTLIKSGVSILSALDIVAKTAGNVLVEEAVYRTRASIQAGNPLQSLWLKAESFPLWSPA
jgi:type IV pilus assembly protein PilC